MPSPISVSSKRREKRGGTFPRREDNDWGDPLAGTSASSAMVMTA